MYGLSNYILTPPFSSVVSMIISFGIISIGYVAINYTKIGILFKSYKHRNFFSPLVGSYIIIFFLYPSISLGILNKKIFVIISITLLILGFIFLFFFIKNFKIKYTKNLLTKFDRIDLILTIAFFLSFFLISLSPITHADALSSHIFGSIEVLNKGVFAKDVLQMKNLLISGGEVFIILGFALKAQELGTLVQYLSTFSLLPIFLSIKNKLNISKLFPVIAILSSYCMLFLISSPKPQMIHIMTNLFVFSFILNSLNILNKNNFFFLSFILTSVLIINIQVKFSFILSSVLFISFFCIYALKNFFTKKYIFVLFFLFLILVIPSFIFRYTNFNTDIINMFISPFPLNIPGFLEMQKSFLEQKSYGVFPLWLIIPNELKNFSSVIGPFIFIIFFVLLKNIKDKKYFFIGLALFFILAINFGQSSARFVFDGFICLVYLIFNCNLKENKYLKFFFNTIRLQSIFLIVAACLFIFRVFPGSISLDYYEKVMHKNANGYSLMQWANSELPENSTILSTHDSISLLNHQSFYYHFLDFIDFKNKSSEIFVKSIKKNNINTVLFFGDESNNYPRNVDYYDKLENCLGKLISYKKEVGRHVGRNPFQEGPLYNGWLFEFNLDNFPNCLK